MTRLVRSELIKLRTVNTWWLFGIGVLVMTALALLVNCLQAHFALLPFEDYVRQVARVDPDKLSNEQLEQIRQQWALGHDVVGQAANIYTSGQFFGILFVALLAILVITNEYYHQTITVTFLATPHRTAVVLAKLITGVLVGAAAWLLALLLSGVTGAVFLSIEGYPSQLGEWPVLRAILLNLAAFAIWAVLGVGFGALLRSQLGATITMTVVYLLGYPVAQLVFFLIRTFVIKKDGVLTAQVVVPAIASQIMTSPTKLFPQSPPQWAGAAVLIAYGALAGIVGTLILRRRDVS
jgi:ABC-2 type transport system permease protein